MNSHQKRAWFMVGTGIAVLVGYVILLPFVGPNRAFAATGVFGITGFTPLIGRKERSDERDKAILRRAVMAGGLASYLTFVASLMVAWGVVFGWYQRTQVSVDVLPQIVMLGACAFFLTQGVSVLLLYRRHVEGDGA